MSPSYHYERTIKVSQIYNFNFEDLRFPCSVYYTQASESKHKNASSEDNILDLHVDVIELQKKRL